VEPCESPLTCGFSVSQAVSPVSPRLVEMLQAADLVVANLECCISRRGARWPAAGKPFFFRAPPAAVERR
jgi:hypothetical protein